MWRTATTPSDQHCDVELDWIGGSRGWTMWGTVKGSREKELKEARERRGGEQQCRASTGTLAESWGLGKKVGRPTLPDPQARAP